MQTLLKQDIDTSIYELTNTINTQSKRRLTRGKNTKVYELIKAEFGGKTMKELAALRSRIYSYLAHGNDEYKKAKGTKSVS